MIGAIKWLCERAPAIRWAIVWAVLIGLPVVQVVAMVLARMGVFL